VPISAAQRLLEADLARPEFLAGVARGDWWLVRPVSELEWPRVYTWVRAAPRPKSPDAYMTRWDLDGYNAQSPTGAFWEPSANSFLPTDRWPKGTPGSVVAVVFKVSGWLHPGRGFYHPYDRLARDRHNEWPSQDPQHVWTNQNTLTDFLSLVHRWLNCESYLGC
jgi:hypothetical protein